MQPLDEKSLDAVYGSGCHPVATLQDEQSCIRYAEALRKFCDGTGEDSEMNWISDDNVDVLYQVAAIFSEPKNTIKWLPAYGCALVVLKDVGQSAGRISLTLVCLDEHRFKLHGGRDRPNGYDHTAISEDYALLFIGFLNSNKLEDFLKGFNQIYSKASCRRGDDRRAGGDQQGHQRTPSFIFALMCQAHQSLCSGIHREHLPKGGFTDVGLHTGGLEVNTSWPLVRSVFHWLLTQIRNTRDCHCEEDATWLFCLSMAYFHLYVLEGLLRTIDGSNAEQDVLQQTLVTGTKRTTELVWTIYRVLSEAALTSSKLADEGQDMIKFFERLGNVRMKVDEVLSTLATESGKQYLLPKLDTAFFDKHEWRYPVLSIPQASQPQVGERTAQQHRANMERNIGWFPILKKNDLNSVYELLKHPRLSQTADRTAAHMVLCTVESFLWEKAEAEDGIDGACIGEAETVKILHIVDKYRTVLNKFRARQESSSLLKVELIGREALVVLIAYCCVDAAARRLHGGMLHGYDVSFNYQDLRHFSLSDKRSFDVALAVASYLKLRSKNQKPLFSLQLQGATFEFAERYGKNSLGSIWKEECKSANSRKEGHWAEVTRKQALARQLRNELAQLKSEKSTADRNLANANARLSCCPRNITYGSKRNRIQNEVDELSSQVNQLSGRISDKQNRIKNAETAPPPVFQPLPSSESKAMHVLFFLHMPTIFRNLARLSLTAQQMLLPKPWTSRCGGADGTETVNVFDNAVKVNPSKTSWENYYNTHQQCMYFNPTTCFHGSQGDVRLSSHCAPPSSSRVGPSHIDQFYSQSDGVWHPDGLVPTMSWTGGPLSSDQYEGREFDPFLVRETLSVAYFTEQLPLDMRRFQWVMRQGGDAETPASRGNRGIATQCEKPSWLSKRGYLAFCSIRSFPHMQLRNICVALQERVLNLAHPCVQTLLWQALHHLGDIGTCMYTRPRSQGTLSLTWKTDLHQGNELLRAFFLVLKTLADEVKETPTASSTAWFLGELSAFFSSYDRKQKDIARSMADAACKWASDIDVQVDESDPKNIPTLRLKQAFLYRQAMLCRATGYLSHDDINESIYLTTKARNLFVETTKKEKKLSKLESRCERVILANFQKVVNAIEKDESILTRAVRSVLQSCPLGLKWKLCDFGSDDKLACFEAADRTGCLYSINVVTGIVLLNGLPPKRLPVEILEHPLYRQTFGRCNFEVASKYGEYETIRPVHGCFYSFFIKNEGRLFVREFDRSNNESLVLELLDTTQVDTWGEEIPERLKKLHSHWLHRSCGTIFLRDVLFSKRSVSFELHLKKKLKDGLFAYDCKCIPSHCKRDDRQPLPGIHRMSSLVLHESPLITSLSKFESHQFIHTIAVANDYKKGNTKAIKRVALPRYGLTFEVRQGWLACLEVNGYKLARHQQLVSCLRGLKNYLILDRFHEGEEELYHLSPQVLLVPSGNVIINEEGAVVIESCGRCDTDRRWHKYDVHPRFNYFVAPNIHSRLHLAALHMATSSPVPDPGLEMTGEERSIQLIRQCWTTRPLSIDERTSLDNVKSLCHGISPTLSLLCQELTESSRQVSFLYTNQDSDSLEPNEMHCDEGTAYLRERQHKPCNARRLLTRAEEVRNIGQAARSSKPFDRPLHPNQAIDDCPVKVSDLEKIQSVLRSLLQKDKPSGKRLRKFPLNSMSQERALGAEMIRELEESWDTYCHTNVEVLKDENSCSLDATFCSMQAEIIVLRKWVERYVLNALNKGPKPDTHWHALGHNLLRLANLVPTASPADLAHLACFPDDTAHFNPLLSSGSKTKIYYGILVWLELCVLEDKAERLRGCSSNSKALVAELQVRRTWDTTSHPAWLVFEVEGRIQIRPEQYAVAKHLIDHPGDILQLNMGLGKTRVILPMLVLHWKYHTQGKITRVHFLSALFTESCDFLHRHLCASVLQCKVFTLPFSRDVQISESNIQILQSTINHCKSEGGVFVVAPEHRLSLELKQKELEMAGEKSLSGALEGIVFGTQWREILDESDELLHNRYQLIYAVGDATILPDGPHRWRVLQSLLEKVAFDSEVNQFFERNPSIVLRQKDSACGAFPPLRLVASKKLETALPDLRNVIAKAIVRRAPREFSWMKENIGESFIVSAMTDPSQGATVLRDLPIDQQKVILAFRGFLASGLLVHSLLKRHRVNYGVARPGNKRLAVPFHGADSPAKRAEFAHPDCAISLTTLAYYSDGLSRSELRNAFEKLLELGDNAKRTIYNDWFALSCAGIKHDDQNKLDKVDKIDLSNAPQQEVLWQYYRRNMKTVNFWLSTCLFPEEMQHYPERLTANPWHLAHNKSGDIVGFSGTNDSYRVMPLQVRQYFPTHNADPIWHELFGTNGKMLDMILQKTLACSEHNDDLLDIVQGHREVDIRAIIDSGAMLAGRKNVDVANILLPQLPGDFRGVAFFDNETLPGEWKILERSGRCLSKCNSPVRERDAFAIFDEPRCRGSDLKLKEDAVAVLTLGPDMCKDKLMQAAGRMRQLERGQKLIMVGGKDVFEKLRRSYLPSESTTRGNVPYSRVRIEPEHVLNWAMQNTVNATGNSLLNWSKQGLFFATTIDYPENAIEAERVELEDFYGEPCSDILVCRAVENSKKDRMRCVGGESPLSQRSREIVKDIVDRANQYGRDFYCAAKVDEECERELELEEEKEEEKEVELQKMKPVEEKDWDFSSVLSATSLNCLPDQCNIISLEDFIRDRLTPTSLTKVDWSKKVFCTGNFGNTVIDAYGIHPKCLNNFLRLVDAMIKLPSGELLLLSEREADKILPTFWNDSFFGNARTTTNNKPQFVHHSFLREAHDDKAIVKGSTLLALPQSIQDNNAITRFTFHRGADRPKMTCDGYIIASIQLFGGETSYGSVASRQALEHMLCRSASSTLEDGYGSVASNEPQHLVCMRGCLHLWDHSDLESICNNIVQLVLQKRMAAKQMYDG